MEKALKGIYPNENVLNHDKAIQSHRKAASYCIQL